MISADYSDQPDLPIFWMWPESLPDCMRADGLHTIKYVKPLFNNILIVYQNKINAFTKI